MDLNVNELHFWATWLMIVLGPITFVALLTIAAPYGRYSKGGYWGPLINPKLAWMLWESPALFIPLAMVCQPSVSPTFINHPLSKRSVLMACFVAHYIYRTVVFPLIMRTGKPAPVSVAAFGALFCVWNGFLQHLMAASQTGLLVYWRSHISGKAIPSSNRSGWYLVNQLPDTSPMGPVELLGTLIWLWGWLNVMKADWTLINLRRPGETGYKIPRGGLFEYVSAANYAAEIIEWTGYAVAAGALPAAAFAFFTFCNIAPRGRMHHKWYIEKFEDYPRSRKAVVPFIW